jgi:hypothetical protein
MASVARGGGGGPGVPGGRGPQPAIPVEAAVLVLVRVSMLVPLALQLRFSDLRNCEYTAVQANRYSGAGTAPDGLRLGRLALVSAPPESTLLDPLDNKLHLPVPTGFLCSELFFGI